MSWQATSWVLDYSNSRLASRLVLLALANHAHEDGTNAWAAVQTLADKAKVSRRTAQYALRDLETLGEISRTGIHQSGAVIYRVAMGAEIAQGADIARVQTTTGGAQSTTPGGAIYDVGGRELCAQTTSEQSTEPSRTLAARVPSKKPDQEALPPDLPSLLAAKAPVILQRLDDIWGERGGDRPTLRGVGLVLRRLPDRDHDRVLAELEHWALAGTGQAKVIRDWPRTFGGFLERSPAAAPTRLATPTPNPYGHGRESRKGPQAA